jgi:hypothetical protein
VLLILILRLALLLVLLFIFLQDMWFRAVHWALFASLAAGLASLQYWGQPGLAIVIRQALSNLGFLILVLSLVTLYFSMKKGKLVRLTDELMGWGDILFLTAIAFYLSPLNYILFFILSMPLALLLWLLWQSVSKNKNKHIPLAGFQSILFIVFLAGDWWYFHRNITDDNWLLLYLIPWLQHHQLFY